MKALNTSKHYEPAIHERIKIVNFALAGPFEGVVELHIQNAYGVRDDQGRVFVLQPYQIARLEQ